MEQYMWIVWLVLMLVMSIVNFVCRRCVSCSHPLIILIHSWSHNSMVGPIDSVRGSKYHHASLNETAIETLFQT